MMRMTFKIRFSIWLVDYLSNTQKTFKEIQGDWFESGANDDGSVLTERSFSRYKKEAEMLFNLDIKCDRYNGSKYSIKENPNENLGKYQNWILNAFRIANLTNYASKSKNIILERAPNGSQHFSKIIEAITHKYSLTFRYKSLFAEPSAEYSEIELIPVFIKYFKQRWYLVGENIDKTCDRIYVLERIVDLKMNNSEKKTISSKLKNLLNPETYFANCYGVIRQFDPITIVIRAFWPQNLYIKKVPIHECQKVINETEEYTDFEYYLRPTYDLKQELMWHRDKIVVLEPESFKNDMIHVLEETLKGYKTGKCCAIDE